MLKIKFLVSSYQGFYLKSFFEKILLDNNLTHRLKKKFSKNVFNSKRMTFSKESNSLFSDYPCFSLFRFFDKVLSLLKKSNANLLRNVFRPNKPENVIKKYKYIQKKEYTEHLREGRPKVALTESSQ